MSEINYPNISVRIKALFIDTVVIVVFLYLASDIFSRFEQVPNFLKIITFLFIFVLYEPLMLVKYGSTVGHRISKIKVQQIDSGHKLKLMTAIGRYMLKALLGWFSFLAISFSKNNQAIHDSIMNSVVVNDD